MSPADRHYMQNDQSYAVTRMPLQPIVEKGGDLDDVVELLEIVIARSLIWMNPDQRERDEKALIELLGGTKLKILAIRGGAPDRPRRLGLKVIDGDTK